MHRSGTSILTRILEKAGIFMGVIKDHNYEAMHFLSLNQQTLWAAGGDWIDPVVPDPIHYKTLPARELYREHFRINTKMQWLNLRLTNPDWGWKDPRNTFTLPMWMGIFPKARIIHVYRDGEEVARSLKKRNSIPGEVHDERLNDLEFNLQLWKKYMDQAATYAEKYGDQYFQIDYQDLVSLDEKAISRLEAFCGCRLKKIFTTYMK